VQFTVNPAAGKPIYEQITEQVRAGIARGQLQPDERLPSVRELSQMLVVNPNTIVRAYAELENQGMLYTRQGMGVFVAAISKPLTKKLRRTRLIDNIDRLLVEAVHVGCELDEVVELIQERARQFEWASTGNPPN
jgi:GntR family transcriptional regulator